MFQGTCEQTQKLATLTHVVVNILGALLLSASNYTMQVLASPKRADVDAAHRKGNTVTIGTQSFKNLRSVGYRRAVLWALLAVSSIPLHLLYALIIRDILSRCSADSHRYNSVIFPVAGEDTYMVAVTTAEFEDGAPFSLSLANRLEKAYSEPLFSTGSQSYETYLGNNVVPLEVPMYDSVGRSVLSELQQMAKTKELVELTQENCIKEFIPGHERKYRNVIAVSNGARSNSSVVWIYYAPPTNATGSTWMCTFGALFGTYDLDPVRAYEETPARLAPCDINVTLERVADWSLGLYAVKNNLVISPETWTVGSHPISKCFVEPVDPPCALRYSKGVFIIVIIANLVKVLVMAITMYQHKRPALVTVGDALASFLEDPDPTTQGICLGKKENFFNGPWNAEPRMYVISKEESLHSSGASWSQWVATSGMFVSTLQKDRLQTNQRRFAITGLSATILFAIVYDPKSGLEWSFGSSIQPSSIKAGRGLAISPLIILANIPQLVLSIDYMLLNRLITSMAGSREWSLFAHQRKGLRTSVPKGAQRSTYWLQLPLKFSIPLTVASAFLHYLASQSLYFGSVQYYDYYDVDGKRKVLEDYTGLGYSPTAIHVLMVALLVPMAAAVMWGWQRNKLGIPPSGFNSAVISAACHPPAEEEDPHLKSIQWGEVPQRGGEHEIGHCSFSSEEVTMPVVGREYA